MNSLSVALLLGAAFMAQSSDGIRIEPGKQLPQSFTIHRAKPAHDVTLRYLLFVPKDYRADGEPWPLLLFLHGIGECSSDDLSRVKIHGPAKIADGRPDFPFVLVSPQLPPRPGYKAGVQYTPQEIARFCDDAWQPDQLMKLVDHVIAELNIDRRRVYVTGLSMGGYGTWRLAATYPNRFAAAVPVCGAGHPKKMAQALSHVPIWAFHGAKDTTVPLAEDEKLVAAACGAGGDVRLTVYPNAAHDAWTATYNNPKVYDWLLAHRLK
ncbi:MAG TPA: prolyl oligopeptidase family serine peptidase [Lacipirellulaceae bacterium]|nr:prolyl oligopeptidase family serine peptidase [Lacipirellulaceae bacterium]